MNSFLMIWIQDHSDHGASKELIHEGSFDAPRSMRFGLLILIRIIPKECVQCYEIGNRFCYGQ